MSKGRKKHQKIICIDCREKVNEGYKRISQRCRKCQTIYRKKRIKEEIGKGK